MHTKKKASLAERISRTAEKFLAEQHYVSVVDILAGIGWLDLWHEKRWQQGQLDCLEAGMQVNPVRISEALTLFRNWATAKGLKPSEATYVSRSPARQPLRFSRSGDPAIEQAYRTHWVSPALGEKAQQRLAEKAAKPPELVVISPLKSGWTCQICAKTGSLLIMQNDAPLCLDCAGLGDLEFLPAGDAGLTRKAKALSERHAVVMRFSRSRDRYERRGLLVEPAALEQARAAVSTPP